MTTPITLTFHPPTPPWSTNQDRNMHWAERHQIIQAWKAATIVAYRQNDRLPHGRHEGHEPWTVHVTIGFTTNRKRDPHNYVGSVVKAIIDGLVHAGLAPDDTSEWITVTEPTLEKGDVVTVTLTPRDRGTISADNVTEGTIQADNITTGHL